MGYWNTTGLSIAVMLFSIGLVTTVLSLVIALLVLFLAAIVLCFSWSAKSAVSVPCSQFPDPPPPPPPPLSPTQLKELKAFEMRNNPTHAEQKMRQILNSEVTPSFPEHEFYSQSVQYGYILDFYCPTLKLGIEVDGASHNNRQGYDWERDTHLQQHGIQILRTSNEQVFNNPQDLVNSLKKIILEKSQQLQNSYSTTRYDRYTPRRY
jgi:very-short-patch-repair endonuclease